MTVLAVIFAGGRGSRMGGADKALVPLDGRPLIDHVIARLAPQCSHLVINANGDPDRFAHRVAADDPASVLDGPFRALETAFTVFAQDSAASHLLHVPTDTPFLPRDLVRRLGAIDAPVAWATSCNQPHPVVALWSRAGAAAARARLRTWSGERFEHLLQACGGVAVAFDDDPDAFLNINTPVDLQTAAARIRHRDCHE